MNAAAASMPCERWEIALTVVSTAPYASLDIRDLIAPHWIVSHVRRGRVALATSGHHFDALPGDVMVHPPGIPFSEANPGPGLHQWVQFRARATAPLLLDLFERYPLPPVLRLDPDHAARYVAAFDRLERSWRRPPGAGRDLETFGNAAALFGVLVDAWEAAGCPAPPQSLAGRGAQQGRFAPIIAYMADHLGERIGRDDLARRAFLHPGSFDRAFRRAHGVAPMRLLQEMRLERARRLLTEGDDTLDAVAAACGLGDGSRLSRLFRARYGRSPGRWRESAKATGFGYIPPLPDETALPTMGASENTGED